jgi:hypothetical protein
MQKFIQQYAQCPNIYGEVVFLLKDHLRSHVFICSTESLPLHADVISRPSQITDLHVKCIIQEYVFRLNRGVITLMSRCMMSLECMYLIADKV